ncbi:MAG TPA: LacI family transcriptional regulator [Lachnospiraceae bacterium]|nr:LacI family transcriptional regulator [Lachnospiraceae bacterium]
MDRGKLSGEKTITIYDIAKEAGVSPATVSRVLTSSANVRQDKKEKITRLIEKYNFTPNAMARSLSDTRSKIIGIIAADVRNPFYSEVFVACEVAARRLGYTVLLCNSLGETQIEKSHLAKLQEQRVDALIQLGGRADDLVSDLEYVELVNSLPGKMPMVVTGKLDGTQCYQVQIDAMKSMDLLMDHLIGLGHREIAIVGGYIKVLSTFEKIQRYKQILQRNHIPFRPEMVEEHGSYNAASAYVRMNRMLEDGNIPTAVIAINDFSAAGIAQSLTEHGYRIPQDISLVSYDNTYIADVLIPKLTSIDYNYENMGRTLVETVTGALEGRQMPRLQMLEPTLVVRDSSGPVRQGERR